MPAIPARGIPIYSETWYWVAVRLGLGVFVATVLRMLFAIRRTGKHGPFRLSKNANRIALIDGDENALIDDWIALGIEKNKIRRTETAPGQHDRGGIGHRRIGDFRVADNNLAHGAVEAKDTGVVHRNAQYAFLSKNRL